MKCKFTFYVLYTIFIFVSLQIFVTRNNLYISSTTQNVTIKFCLLKNFVDFCKDY